jgi:tricarballylate dehydrogenase
VVDDRVDVVVVGGGNAGLVAALSAAERGRRVVLLERGAKGRAGGNSYFTAGATRIAHDGLDDLRSFVDVDERHARTVVPPYSPEEFASDMARVTDGRNDPDLTRVLIAEARDTIAWLTGHGVRYRLMYERQAYESADTGYLFWGGLHVGATGGGAGLVESLTAAAERLGVDIRYDWHALELLTEGDGETRRVVGVGGEYGGAPATATAGSVVLAAGGFESDAVLRREHLGPGWENARVRGTPYNRGELLQAAIALGADLGGDWSTCHSTAWDAEYADNESNWELTNRLTRQSYPLGVMINRDGKRFVDEGADFRNYTYAKYGREILAQRDSIAYQVYDAALRPMLRSEEYDMPGVSVYQSDTLEGLATAAGFEPDAFVTEVAAFNAGIDRTVPFDPTVKDGRSSTTTPPKSNWASPIETAPFYAYPVTCGITFTFGGLRSDTEGRVLDSDGRPIPGLLVAGEMLGGLFSGNYPGGTGLTAGAVFGRRAGAIA